MIGRLCVLEGEYPVAFPVNYRLVFDSQGLLVIVLRTREGNSLDRERSNVSFQVDGLDEMTQTGWSILARGELRSTSSTDAPRWLSAWDPHSWVEPTDRWLYIAVTHEMTGRRLQEPEESWAVEDCGYL